MAEPAPAPPLPATVSDGNGLQVIDPTNNVANLVSGAMNRQDDLRSADRMLVEARLAALNALVTARFDAIARELELVENRRGEQKTDTKIAVDAALSAAEKAVKEQTVASEKSILKSETASAEQSRQQYTTFTTALAGVQGALADLKERVSRMETLRQGGNDTKVSQRGDLAAVVGVAGVVLFLVAIGVTVLLTTIAR